MKKRGNKSFLLRKCSGGPYIGPHTPLKEHSGESTVLLACTMLKGRQKVSLGREGRDREGSKGRKWRQQLTSDGTLCTLDAFVVCSPGQLGRSNEQNRDSCQNPT